MLYEKRSLKKNLAPEEGSKALGEPISGCRVMGGGCRVVGWMMAEGRVSG